MSSENEQERQEQTQKRHSRDKKLFEAYRTIASEDARAFVHPNAHIMPVAEDGAYVEVFVWVSRDAAERRLMRGEK